MRQHRGEKVQGETGSPTGDSRETLTCSSLTLLAQEESGYFPGPLTSWDFCRKVLLAGYSLLFLSLHVKAWNSRRCFRTLSIILQFMNVWNFKDVHSRLLAEHVGKGASDYLQVELQALLPLFQDFGNPVSDMFWGHLRRLYALLKLENHNMSNIYVLWGCESTANCCTFCNITQ